MEKEEVKSENEKETQMEKNENRLLGKGKLRKKSTLNREENFYWEPDLSSRS
jgi:hypothetical protein